MKTDDIINTFNDWLNNKRKELNMHDKVNLVYRLMIQKKLGSYKNYILELYLIDECLHKKLIKEISNTINTNNIKEEDCLELLNSSLLQYLFTISNNNDIITNNLWN